MNDRHPARDREDAVARYYVTKKRRYLTDPDRAAAMRTGTPHDWEEAERYARITRPEDA